MQFAQRTAIPILTVIALFAIAVHAQENSPSSLIRNAPASHSFIPVIQFSLNAPLPTESEPSAAAEDEKAAEERYYHAQSELAAIIKSHPNTRAGRAVAAMIKRAGLRTGPQGYDYLYPSHTFFSGAAINR